MAPSEKVWDNMTISCGKYVIESGFGKQWMERLRFGVDDSTDSCEDKGGLPSNCFALPRDV